MNDEPRNQAEPPRFEERATLHLITEATRSACAMQALAQSLANVRGFARPSAMLAERAVVLSRTIARMYESSPDGETMAEAAARYERDGRAFD